MLGHICIIPDDDWKEHGMPDRKIGDPTHFLNPSKAGFHLKDLPMNFQAVMKVVPAGSQDEKHRSIGSNWWRAEQFYRRAIDAASRKNVPEMIREFGLMGHFIADNANTFHVVKDFDGYESGHGGIHDFYETIVPGVFGPELISEIVTEANRIYEEKPKFLMTENFLEAMKELSLEAASEEELILKSDPLLKASIGKKPADRKEPEAVIGIWKPIIVRSLAKSSLLLAKCMDAGYVRAGSPPLKRHMMYPFRVPFIKPDYLGH